MASGTWARNSPEWRLMWTNSSPSNNFSTATIAMDLTPYSEVKVVFNANTSSSYRTTFITQIDGSSSLMYAVTALASNAYMSLEGRYVSANSTGVTINAARIKQFNSNTIGTTDNSAFIPVYIFAR